MVVELRAPTWTWCCGVEVYVRLRADGCGPLMSVLATSDTKTHHPHTSWGTGAGIMLDMTIATHIGACSFWLLLCCMPAETKPKRAEAWAFIRSLAKFAPKAATRKLMGSAIIAESESAARWITAGLSVGSLQRITSWLRKFLVYLIGRVNDAGTKLSHRVFNNNEIALDFLAAVADEDAGMMRPQAAVRAIDFIRKLLGVRELKADPRTRMLLEGVRRANPRLPVGALPFPPFMLAAVATRWGNSKCWWKRMVALMTLLAFLAMLRGAELVAVPRRGLCWVNGAVEVMDPEVTPRIHTGVLMLLPSRKSSQSQPSWAVVKACFATKLLRRHIAFLNVTVPGNRYLFPARKRRVSAGRRVNWVPNTSSGISTSSFLSLLRRALQQICGLTHEQAAKFTLHSLRVGGMNYLHRMGVPIPMCAKLMAHKSPATSRLYLRRFAADLIGELTTMRQPQALQNEGALAMVASVYAGR